MTSAGACDYKSKIIRINKKTVSEKKELKNILIHEMIHAYECALPPTAQQLLVLFLYQKLSKRLGKRKLDKIITIDQHLILNVHTLLFLLKSLTIDLARKLPLGTIFGYDRLEYFSPTSFDGGLS